VAKENEEQNSYSGFIASFETVRSLMLKERLDRDYEFTDSFSINDWGLQKREIFILALSRKPLKIHGAAFVEKAYGNGGTGKPKYSFSHLLSFGEPITKDELNFQFDKKLEDVLSTPSSGGLRLESADWQLIIATIRDLRPDIADELDFLLTLIDKESMLTDESDNRERVLAEQRDSIGMVMDIAGLDRKGIIKTLDPKNIEEANSILDLFENPKIDERSHVEEDAAIIRLLLGEAPENVKSKTIGYEMDRYVTVHVSDKSNLETILGTDLIIYQKHYGSLLLIQYKLMDYLKTGLIKGWSYKPDNQFYKQISTIISIRDQCLGQFVEKSMWDLRLNSDPYYFKFCERRAHSSREDSLVKGMNIPLEHLIKQMSFLHGVTKTIDERIGYQNIHRYLNNTEFISLAKGGWIGSDLDSSKCIQKIAKEGREAGRATILAVVNIRDIDLGSLRKVMK
jgi:hypothetical protein